MLSSNTFEKVQGSEATHYPQGLIRRLTVLAALVLSDVLAFASSYFLFRHGKLMPLILLPTPGGTPDIRSGTDIFLILGVVFVFIRCLLGDYSRRQLFWDGARATTSTLCLVAIPDAMLITLIGGSHFFPPLILSWLFAMVAIPLYRQISRRILNVLGLWNIPTALVGTGRKARKAYQGLRGTLSLGFDVRYLIAGPGQSDAPEELSEVHRITPSDAEGVAETLRSLGCRQVIVSAEDAQEHQISELIRSLVGSQITVAVIPSLQGLPLFGMRTNYLFGQDLLLLQLRNNLSRIPSQIMKRIVDFLGSILIIILAFPIWATVMAAIKLHDGGPIFYWQPRVGRNGRIFPCIKFRTMAQDADERLECWKLEQPDLYAEFLKSYKLRDDPRVTGPGNWLRRTSLDELPQLLNVIVGQMSMVGPRPIPLAQLRSQYGSAEQLYLRVRPGMTGLWQVSGRNDTSNEERVVFDEWYILNWSLWYDFVILIQTIRIVFTARGAY